MAHFRFHKKMLTFELYLFEKDEKNPTEMFSEFHEMHREENWK